LHARGALAPIHPVRAIFTGLARRSLRTVGTVAGTRARKQDHSHHSVLHHRFIPHVGSAWATRGQGAGYEPPADPDRIDVVTCILQVTRKTSARSLCPISTSLDVVGDRWTLVIVRDLINGKSKYAELAESPEQIPTNILASRLADMTAAGLITRRAYQRRPTRYAYTLTPRGEGLLPVLQAFCRWANAEYPKTWHPPRSFMQRRPRRR
jgi:DNA-binding HxlR family transcriptional regulator